MATGVMTGNKWEGGYVYAWKINPSEYAIKNSGARMVLLFPLKPTHQLLRIMA